METTVMKPMRRGRRRQSLVGGGGDTAAAAPTVQEHCAQVLLYLQQSWRDVTEDTVREALISLALALSQETDEPSSSSTEFLMKQIQRGLHSLLQRHYASYKKDGIDKYLAFGAKFDLLLDTVLLAFSAVDQEPEAVLNKAFVDAEEEGVQVLITLFQTVLNRHPDLFLSIVKCMQRVSRSAETRAKVLQIILSRLAFVDASQLPCVLSILGEYPLDNMESIQTISTVRKLWNKLEQRESSQMILISFASAFVQWFSKEWNGHFLAIAYLQSIDESSSSSEADILSLDVTVLLSLSLDPDFGEQANQILDSWVDRSDFFACLHQTLLLVQVPEEEDLTTEDMDWQSRDFCRELVSTVITLALRQLRLEDRKYAQSVHDFCLQVLDTLLSDCERPAFVDSIAQLWRDLFGSKNEDVPRVLYDVMRSLSQKATALLRRTRYDFIHALESPTILDASVATDICAIAVPLFGLDDNEELMNVLDRLLFAPVVSVCDSRQANGMILAAEIIRSGAGHSKMTKGIESRVLRILLPNDRRVVPPEIGSPGLAFLESRPGNSTSAFRDIQMILANTGLIQRLSGYKQARRKYTPMLGYTTLKTQSTTMHGGFIFCAAFFLNQIDHEDLSQWDSIVRWVFDLVNSYLASGRQRSKTSWNPKGWLQATVEFPELNFPFDAKGSQQKKAVTWLLDDYGKFDARLARTSPPPANFRSTCVDILVRNPDELTALHSMLLTFALGLLVGIGLSAGVLKNAFAHYKDTTDKSNQPSLLEMIDHQIMKIYHLKDKITDLENVLVPLESALRKLEIHAKTNDNTAVINHDSLISSLVQLKETMGKISENLFYTTDYIDNQVLWESLTDQRGTELLKNHLRFVLSMSSPTKHRPRNDEVGVMVHSRSRIASQLLYCSGSPTLEQPDHVARLASFTFFVIPLLPKLRGALSAMDSPPLDSWIRHAAVSIQLLTLCFTREIELSHSTAFMVEVLSSSIYSDNPSVKPVSEVVHKLQLILSAADDVHVANGLLEMLSILGSQNSNVVQSVTVASTAAIRKPFTNSGETTNVSELPYSLSVLTKSLKGTANALPAFRKALEATLCRTPTPRSRSNDTFWVYRYSLLRHFGLLVQNGASHHVFEVFHTDLSFEIESILDWLSRKSLAATKTSGTSPIAKGPPKKPVSSFPCLTPNNFADFFEVALHMTVGALVLYPPVKVPRPDDGDAYPYRQLDLFLRHFHSLCLLFTKYYAQFPRKSVGIMHSTARHLMDVAMLQLNRCVDWRRSYQMPKCGIVQQYDPGSLRYLGALVRSFRELIVEGLCKVAQIWNEDKAPQVVSKSKTLKQFIDRFSGLLEDVSFRHRLSLYDEQETSPAWVESKRRRVGNLTGSSLIDGTISMETEGIDEDYVDGSEDGEGYDDDESFGAAGEWGDEDCGNDDDSVDSAEPITIHLAT